MDLYDLYNNPHLKNDYALCLNWTVSNFKNIYCFCERHRVFVSEKQTKRRHCKKGCSYQTLISKENKDKLIKRTEKLLKSKAEEVRFRLTI